MVTSSDTQRVFNGVHLIVLGVPAVRYGKIWNGTDPLSSSLFMDLIGPGRNCSVFDGDHLRKKSGTELVAPTPLLSRSDKLSIITARSGAAGLGAVILQALLPTVDLHKFNEKI
jgi:hypothetical protein